MSHKDSRSPQTSRRLPPAQRRPLMLGGGLLLWMLVIAARLYDLQIIRYVDMLDRARRQQQQTVRLAPQRGQIFDRQWHVLAMSLPAESIFAVPSQVPDHERVAKLLAPILGLDPVDLAARLDVPRPFCLIKRKVTDEQAAQVRALHLKGIYSYRESKRYYPKQQLAGEVLGYVGMDDQGLAGIEFCLNSLIQGTPGRMLLVRDARRHWLDSTELSGMPGKDVVLTIDENIQYIAEKALAKGVADHQAAAGVAIVENPHTGEILAMAAQPPFDPNQYFKTPLAERTNRALSWIYEPGSTFKLVTVSAVLEEGLARPDEVIDCQMGRIELAGHVIHDWKRWGLLTVREVVIHSSDVGAIKLGLRLGAERFYQYMRRFGFGSPTGIELPGEQAGLLRSPASWSGISIGEMSIGQEVGVTALQLISAYAAIANRGVRVQPHILREVTGPGAPYHLAPRVSHRVLSERTSALMREILTQVVEQGTGKPARLNGYSAAGKTGTAQKVDASGHYSRSRYVSSFVGFAPASNPALTILVSIDSPVGGHHGGEVAGPVFKEIAEQALSYLNVPQDRPAKLPLLASSQPAEAPSPKEEARNSPAEDRVSGEGLRASAGSLPREAPVETVAFSKIDRPLPSNTTVIDDDAAVIHVPDFAGLPMRVVAEECQKQGLDLSVEGTGLAVEQSPAAGTRVVKGSRMWVRFAR